MQVHKPYNTCGFSLDKYTNKYYYGSIDKENLSFGGTVVQTSIVYLKSNRRRPVRLLSYLFPQDIQQRIPTGWCTNCGAMLYSPQNELCRRCKGGTIDESKSLHDMQTGEMPG